METHSSTLTWRIPGTEEPGGLQSAGSQESDRTEPPPPRWSVEEMEPFYRRKKKSENCRLTNLGSETRECMTEVKILIESNSQWVSGWNSWL